MTFRVFISSVQDEFAEERRRLKRWLTTDLFVSRFVESVFLFEDVPSRGKPPQDVFLDEVKSSDIYIGLIGSQYYGKTSAKRGVSATEREYDFAGIIESLGTGIERMIKACRTANLPDPTWEQRGHTLVVTIWKDMWTDARLREAGVTSRQMRAMSVLKAEYEMAVARYMELTGVTRNTATTDLKALASAGVVKRTGAGRGATYILQKCTINAQNAPSDVRPDKTPINKGLLSSHDPTKSPVETINEPVNGPVNGPLNEPRKSIEEIVYSLITSNPGISRPRLISRIGKSRTTISRALIRLKSRIEHRGSDKTGGYYAL